MGRVEDFNFGQQDFHSKEDIIQKIQSKFTRFEQFDSCKYPRFLAVILSNGFKTIIEERKGFIIGSALEREKNAPFETLMLTWHGLERAETFWDQVKGRVYPEFSTRRQAPEIDYVTFSQRAFDVLDQKYRMLWERNNNDGISQNILTTKRIYEG